RDVLPDDQLDTLKGQKADVGRVGLIARTIHVRDHLALNRSNLRGTQRLLPDGEEVAEVEDAPDGRLNVDHAILGVGVDPVKTRPVGDERAFLTILNLPRLANADTERD